MNERLARQAVDDGVDVERTGGCPAFETAYRLVRELGVKHVNYYATGISGSPMPVIVSTYLSEWISLYQERGYFFIDPVVERADRSGSPMEWDHLSGLEPSQKAFIDLWRQKVGARGISIPLGSTPVVAAISITSDEPVESWNARKSEICWKGMVAGQRIHRMALAARQGKEDPQPLSTVQSDCLAYLAIGMDVSEIGVVLSMREAQVRKNLDEAQRRMNALSHSHAIAKAAAMGYIGR